MGRVVRRACADSLCSKPQAHITRCTQDLARSAAGRHSSTSAAAMTNEISGAKADSILGFRLAAHDATTIATATPGASRTILYGVCAKPI